MIEYSHFPAEKPYYVVGLARTGLSVVRALRSAGQVVYAYDDEESHCLQAKALGAVIQKPADMTWTEVQSIILSPGIPGSGPKAHSAAVLAQQHSVPILGDIDLFAQALARNPRGAKVIGITGTNGKSTTAALLHHLINYHGVTAYLGGNIGTPVLELPAPKDPEDIYVLELSSYQLERAHYLNCDVAVWLNLTPDHIDRHGSLEAYAQAKKRIFKPWGEPQIIIIGVEDAVSLAVYHDLKKDTSKTIVTLSSLPAQGTAQSRGGESQGTFQQTPFADYTYDNARIFYHDTLVLDLADRTSLLGRHNMQNITAVLAVMGCLGISCTQSAITSFQGLPHRQEYCGAKGPLQFINDSKATNINSTLQALSCYERVYLILGGVPKGEGLQGLESYKDRVHCCYLIGQAAPEFKQWLDAHNMENQNCGTLEQAVLKAIHDASLNLNSEGTKTVLLSPACASFDQFKNFEDRGLAFKNYVQSWLINHPEPIAIKQMRAHEQ